MSVVKPPSPHAQLAGCVWLPRIIAKARLLAANQLPAEYVPRFGHPGGTDGQFLSYFSLTREDIVRIAPASDEEVAAWFKSLPSTHGDRIAGWNHLAVNLGRPGFPMAERLPVALTTTYQHLAHLNPSTIFALLEADERDAT